MEKKISIILIAIALLAGGCKNKKQGETLYELSEKTLPCSISCSDERKDSLSVLGDDLMVQLIPLLKKGKGFSPVLINSLPKEWVTECQLENLSTDFDIWIISNHKAEATHKVLLTIKTTEDKYQIIDALLIAYVAATESTNKLESEEWTCQIEKDYTIKIRKEYKELYSYVSDSVIPDNKEISIEDVYHITLNGFISYEEPTIFDTDYMAIIQFADTSEVGVRLDEEWVWNLIHLQEHTEDHSILLIEATRQFDNISIVNYQGQIVDKVNLKSFLSRHTKGYIFLKKGSKPKYHKYGSADECIKSAFSYFGLDSLLLTETEIDLEIPS